MGTVPLLSDDDLSPEALAALQERLGTLAQAFCS